MRAGLVWLILLPLTVSLALADAPTTSLVPHPRPAATEPAMPAIRPKPRPPIVVPAAQQQSAREKPTASVKGSVCGNPDIRGVALRAIASPIRACQVQGPVSVTAIGGVRLVPAATISCAEAQALASWIDKGLQPQFGDQVARLLIADSYSCRPRNNVRGAKISEHGSGNAIDISGVVLTTGKVLTVSSNFAGPLRAAYRAGCGAFHTTLGPGSDGYHETHIHLDVARNGGNPYCR